MWSEFKQLWAVRYAEDNPNVWIGSAVSREEAKRRAFDWFGGNQNYYVVEPITNRNDRIKFDLVLSI